MTDTTTIADTTQEVTEATQQAVKQVNQITQYLQDSIPGLLHLDWKCWRHWLLSLSEDW